LQALHALAVGAPGFNQVVQANLVLPVGDKVRQDFALVIGEHFDVATVVIVPGQLQLESAQINDVIVNQQVVELRRLTTHENSKSTRQITTRTLAVNRVV
jgi:hypothetical protein